MNATQKCRTAAVLVAALLGGLGGCAGQPTPGNENGTANENLNVNENTGTGNTVADLPDLGIDDALGEGEGQDTLVPGLILLGFDEELSEEQFRQRAETAADTLGGEVVDVVSGIRLCTISVEPGQETAALDLAIRFGSVDFAETNYAGQLAGISDNVPAAISTQFAQYQLFLTNAIRTFGVSEASAAGVTVAVLDSGCSINHPELIGTAVFEGANFVADETGVEDDVAGGHGTGIVGLLAAGRDVGEIAGLIPDGNVTVYKVADGDGRVSLAHAVQGIAAALSGDVDGDPSTSEIPAADILNISFSFSGDYESMRRAIFAAADAGAIVVASAGNNGRSADAGTARYPAGYSTVVSVGASDIEDRPAPFTNHSAELELLAPGVDLFVAAPSATFRFADGSSYAAAQVSAALAYLRAQNPEASLTELRGRLQTRGDTLPADSGLASADVTRLNFYAALVDENTPPEPYLIPDGVLVSATGVAADTLAASQVGVSQSALTPEAFQGDALYWYGYFPGDDVTFELIDGGVRRALIPSSVVPSTIDLFLEFLRGIELGTLTASFSVLQQAVFEVHDLGGERRAIEVVAIKAGQESDSRTLIYNPLQRGLNIVAYKNFDSAVWHFRDEEGDLFDSAAADVQLLGSGAQPEVNWDSSIPVDRVQLGSSLDPAYFVTSEVPGAEPLAPPVKLGDCAGADVPQQICGAGIALPGGEIGRIVVRSSEPGGFAFATLDVIYVP